MRSKISNRGGRPRRDPNSGPKIFDDKQYLKDVKVRNSLRTFVEPISICKHNFREVKGKRVEREKDEEARAEIEEEMNEAHPDPDMMIDQDL